MEVRMRVKLFEKESQGCTGSSHLPGPPFSIMLIFAKYVFFPWLCAAVNVFLLTELWYLLLVTSVSQNEFHEATLRACWPAGLISSGRSIYSKQVPTTKLWSRGSTLEWAEGPTQRSQAPVGLTTLFYLTLEAWSTSAVRMSRKIFEVISKADEQWWEAESGLIRCSWFNKKPLANNQRTDVCSELLSV